MTTIFLKPEIIRIAKQVLGPYTIVEVEDVTGKKGWGLARKSHIDRQDPNMGYKIALGRATKSLEYKINEIKKRQRTVFMA